MKKKFWSLYRKFYDRFIYGYDLWHQLYNVAVLIAIIGSGISVLLSLFFIDSPIAIAVFLFTSVFAISCLVLSMKVKDVIYAATLFSVVANFILFPVMFFTSGGHLGGMPLWFLFSLVLIWVTIRKRILYVVYALSLIFQCACIWFGMKHPEYVVQFPSEEAAVFDLIQSLILVSFIFGLIIRYQNRAYEKKREELDAANAVLAESNERITLQAMYTLAKTIDAKDRYTNGHSRRVAKYARMIAEKMDFSEAELEHIYNMAMLHDIGKIGVPDEIINKPSRLEPEEYEIIKTHPATGYEILSEMPELEDIGVGARWHHERYDGNGYPDGLKGEEIPLVARIISVADAYDAMTSNRSYRSYMSQRSVREELKKGRGTQFDPQITDIMLKIMKEDTDYELMEI